MSKPAVTLVTTRPIDAAGWVTFDATIAGTRYWVQAKVYDEPSDYGIGDGRVSKLAVCLGTVWSSRACVFNYDRGYDVVEMAEATIDALVEAIEAACPAPVYP